MKKYNAKNIALCSCLLGLAMLGYKGNFPVAITLSSLGLGISECSNIYDKIISMIDEIDESNTDKIEILELIKNNVSKKDEKCKIK